MIDPLYIIGGAWSLPKTGIRPRFREGMLFGIMLYWWSMIFSENRYPLFGIMLYWWGMIFSENRYPLFGIML